MAVFNNMAITTAGQLLYAEAQGGTPIVFTRMQIGSSINTASNPTNLQAPTYYVAISGIVTTVNNQAVITGIINNNAMTETTTTSEIGLWATDPNVGEILYSYAYVTTVGGVLQSDNMAPGSLGALSWAYQINVSIGNATNVTATISNLEYDYNIISTNTSFITIVNGTQKDINESIDTIITAQGNAIGTINTTLTEQGNAIGTINTALTEQGNAIDAIADWVVEAHQDTGGSLNGYTRTAQGFVTQWGRVTVAAGAGTKVTFRTPFLVAVSGINTSCTTGMYLTYTPKTFYTGMAPIPSFNVATNSPYEEEIFWHAEGRSS